MPKECPNGTLYIVKRGDTLYKIARKFNITVEQIIAVNKDITNKNLIFIGQEICIPGPEPGVCPGMEYTIRPGDTLYALARRFNVTIEAISLVNPGIDPNNLQIGQKICIPGNVPVVRPGFLLLNSTDSAPESKGFLFIEQDVNSLLVGVTNVPKPGEFPEGEVYKIWIRRRGTDHYAVGVLDEIIPDYFLGRIIPEFPIFRADTVLITSEPAENITAPQGLAVAAGTLIFRQ